MLQRLQPFGAGGGFRQRRRVVVHGRFEVAGVLRGARGLEGLLRAIHHGCQVGGQRDERKHVPGVVAEDRQDVGWVAGARNWK